MTGKEIRAKLAAPFAAGVVKWKAQAVKGNRALAVAYIDARDVEDRLNDVLGIDGWDDKYTPAPDGCFLCELSLTIGERVVTRSDLGAPAECPDKGDKAKGAVSDALKRAAIKFGVGRYVYKLEPVWTDYDPAAKKLTKPPALPDWALPKPGDPKPEAVEPAPPPARTMPKPGADFVQRIKTFDEEMAREGLCNTGAVFLQLRKAGDVEGYPDKLDEWNEEAIRYAVRCLTKFRDKLRADRKGGAPQQQPQKGGQQHPAATAAQVRSAGLNFFGDGDGGHDEFCRWLNDQGVPDPKALDGLPAETLGKLLAAINRQETPTG